MVIFRRLLCDLTCSIVRVWAFYSVDKRYCGAFFAMRECCLTAFFTSWFAVALATKHEFCLLATVYYAYFLTLECLTSHAMGDIRAPWLQPGDIPTVQTKKKGCPSFIHYIFQETWGLEYSWDGIKTRPLTREVAKRFSLTFMWLTRSIVRVRGAYCSVPTKC